MSIHDMIAAHPEVAGDLNEQLATAVRHAMFCSAISASCADACVAEPMDMRQCVRICLDCSDVCQATAMIALRRTGSNPAVLRSMLATCYETCRICAEECSRHDSPHCRRCAEMCDKCSRDCARALGTVDY